MATILAHGDGDLTLDLYEYVQTALAGNDTVLTGMLNQSEVSSSITDERADIYLTEGGHLVFLGHGLAQDSGIATITFMGYSDASSNLFEATGNLTIDKSSGDFLGGSLSSVSLGTSNARFEMEGSIQMDGLDNFHGDVSLITFDALGVALTLTGDLYFDGSSSTVTGDITQFRADWGDGQSIEFQDISVSFDALDLYGTFHDLYTGLTSGDDSYYGSSADDTFDVGGGNDTIMGGSGNDTVVVDGIVSQYLAGQASGDDTLAGPEGTDTLSSVEYVRFGTSVYTTDVPWWDALTSNPLHLSEQITDLYVAYFNRGPDSEGFDYWFHEIYTGSKTLRTIAEDFAWSNEYRSMYPDSLTNDQFVEQIYQNLFDRAPDQGGWDYWSGRLDAGSVHRSGFILDVIEGAYAPTSGPEDRTLIDNKHDASLYYTAQLSTNPQEGYDFAIVDLLNLVTGEDATVEGARNVIDYAFDNPITLTGVMADEMLFDSLWTAA